MDFTDYTRETLKGLQGVTVIVETVNSDAQDDDLDTNIIQTEIEQRLAAAGFQVFSREQWRTSLGKPWLYVSVNTQKYLSTYFFSLDVQLKQDVMLPRRTDIVTSCSTWEVGSLGFIDAPNLSVKLREYINKYVDKFIADYRAVNS